eukprot:gene12328-12463_t
MEFGLTMASSTFYTAKSIALAAGPGQLPDLWLTCLFGVGAVLMRGAGCTINDLWDRDIDKMVERTRSRPLAAGTITAPAALAFLAAQLSLGLAILLQLNTYTQALGVSSLLLVGTYPLMKRVTWWPQAFLGLTFNYGVLMGWAAVQGCCDWSVVLPMYVAAVNWTLVYDTIYACQDRKDDALVGVKSTALLFGNKTKQWLTGFAVLQACGLWAAGSAAGCQWPYYAAVMLGSAHQTWQLKAVDLNNGADCMAKFVSNKWYGALVYSGIIASNMLV